MRIHLLSGASALALGACAYEPAPLPVVAAQKATTDTTVSAAIGYQDPLAGYTYREPTGPRDWRTVNEEQSEGN
ncbi:hypothetical protein SAMN05443999_11914 [Roseovarius azorensis]|uniref:Uncharacterized protein n=1 Tax=Roseovarius azorensis TaxID=1287727 RepID=A0A1H7X8B6_9RHOB|nr:hypothetical protein SAMN05443999_11914 [Roseovarius azorensis]